MWDLLRSFHKNGVAKLLPFNVHQMLPQLVTTYIQTFLDHHDRALGSTALMSLLVNDL